MKVPFNDLRRIHAPIEDKLIAAFRAAIMESNFIGGNAVALFEENFKAFTGSKHCVSAGNGTDTLMLAFKALGVCDGAEVIVPAQTWISTAEAVTAAGGRPVFADTTAEHLIDLEALQGLITDKTVGIVPVHLYGKSVDMVSLSKIAEKNNLWIVEDCAQAHGAYFGDKHVGNFGQAGSFSFYPGKNLGALGDAGALILNSESLSNRMRALANHGGKGIHEYEGYNSRLDSIQAEILSIKLAMLSEWTNERRRLAKVYIEELKDLPFIELPRYEKFNEHSFHLFVIKTANRDALQKHLGSKSVSTLVNYPRILPDLPAYRNHFQYKGHFSVARKNASSILSLPIFPGMTELEQVYVIDQIKCFRH